MFIVDVTDAKCRTVHPSVYVSEAWRIGIVAAITRKVSGAIHKSIKSNVSSNTKVKLNFRIELKIKNAKSHNQANDSKNSLTRLSAKVYLSILILQTSFVSSLGHRHASSSHSGPTLCHSPTAFWRISWTSSFKCLVLSKYTPVSSPALFLSTEPSSSEVL